MYTVSLLETDKLSTEGSKSYNLGKLIKSGLPIPPGFVITVYAYKKFLERNNLKEKIENLLPETNNLSDLRQASAEIENLIWNASIPDDIKTSITKAYEHLSYGEELNISGQALDIIKAGRDKAYVAVRSSPIGDATFAGQLRNYVNIYGNEKLLDAIKKCWASLYTTKAIFYRKVMNIEPAETSLIIQKMINSEKSGVVLTSHPLDRNKIVVEAAWGLGQSLSSGFVIPDSYILDKSSGEIEKNIGRKLIQIKKDQAGNTIKERVSENLVDAQVLDDKQLSYIIDLAKKIEDSLGDQIIEWCEERGRYYILQSRSLKISEISEENSGGESILSGFSASPGKVKGRVKKINSLEPVEYDNIIVTKTPSTDLTIYMKKVSGIITDEGGISSNLATISREFNVPCLVGTGEATQKLQDDQEITVDATNGHIYAETQVQEETYLHTEIPGNQTPLGTESSYLGNIKEPPGSDTGEVITATEIKITDPSIEETLVSKSDGVGLLKGERIIKEPNIENIEELIGRVAKHFYPKPVWYKIYDDADELDEEPEANPLLGLHGIRRNLNRPELFKLELEAIKRLTERGLNNISLLIPFITNIEELRAVKSMVIFPLKLGIIVETPAAAINIESFCKEGIDFISIGSTNLTQLTLGVDKSNPLVSRLYSETHPGVLKLIKHVIETCKRYNIKTSIFGDTVRLAEKLVEYGIDSISVDPDYFIQVKNIVARTERRLLLDKLRKS